MAISVNIFLVLSAIFIVKAIFIIKIAVFLEANRDEQSVRK